MKRFLSNFTISVFISLAIAVLIYKIFQPELVLFGVIQFFIGYVVARVVAEIRS